MKILIVLLLLSACETQVSIPIDYPRMIGDISFDETIDNSEFALCNDEKYAVQYYAYSKLTGEKPHASEKYEVERVFKENYKPENVKKESGLLRIRFLVNCQGESGRFRMIGMDENYKEKEFDTSISNQVLSITSNLLKWKPFKTKDQVRDYYMYLIFKIENGEIIEILP